jgi:hypothetical protein
VSLTVECWTPLLHTSRHAVWGRPSHSIAATASVSSYHPQQTSSSSSTLLFSSFAADGSEYSNDTPDVNDDDEDTRMRFGPNYRDQDDTPTIELGPVPMSKNSGNRFVTIVWDRELVPRENDSWSLHESRIEYTEDHVMYCRKANLYNDTFNTESMVDVLWSLPM